MTQPRTFMKNINLSIFYGLLFTVLILMLLNHSVIGQCQYKLPFQIGSSYLCTQGNGGSTSHSGIEQYAWDFQMNTGTTVVASRGGTVSIVVESWSNGNCPYPNCTSCVNNVNRIVINHGDGTYALYLHLTYNGSSVSVGDVVSQGQIIGYSGNTGCSTGPHLHFMVMNSGASWYTQSIPISFCDVTSNSGIPVSGSTYTSSTCISGPPVTVTPSTAILTIGFNGSVLSVSNPVTEATPVLV